jgi:hypothetical protein
MNQLSLVPACDKHGCEKVWYLNQKTSKGQWVCRGCNKENSRKWRQGKSKRAELQQQTPVCLCTRCGVECPGSWHAKRTCEACQRELGRLRNVAYRASQPPARRAYYERNRDKALQQARLSALRDPERIRANQRRWRERNPGVSNAIRAARMGRGNCVISLDAIDKAIIKAMYDKRDRTGLGGGLGPGHYNVDHVQPLSLGGVHAPWNLQILTWEENSSKKNKRPTLREVMKAERRYRLLRRVFERELGTAAS